MDQTFEKPGLGERVQQLGYLLKHTVTIVGRDTDIVGPWLRTAIYATLMVTAFFGGIAAIALNAGGIGTLLLLAAFALFVYKHFYYTRQDMAQSWLVAETALRLGRSAHPAGLRHSQFGDSFSNRPWLSRRSSSSTQRFPSGPSAILRSRAPMG